MHSSPSVILIIDSDPITLTGVAAVLNMQGHECHCASNEESAIKAAASLPLDIIICDVEVDGESGLDLCTQIRTQIGIEDVPVIFVSAMQVADVVCRAHEANAAYFLSKPFVPETLIEIVDTALWMPHLVHNRSQHDMQSGENHREKFTSKSNPSTHHLPSRRRRREFVQ